MFKLVLKCSLIFLVLFCSTVIAKAQNLGYRLRKVAATQEQANYEALATNIPPTINIKGDMVFIAKVVGQGSSIQLVSSNKTVEVAAEGKSAPTGVKYSSFTNARLNDQGQILFQATLDNNTQGLFLYDGTATQKLLVTGDAAPNGDSYQSFLASALNDNGDIAFICNLTQAAGDTLFLISKGQAQRIIGTGDPLPGGGNFSDISCVVGLSMNNSPTVTFSMDVSDDEAAGAIFTYANGALTRLVDEENDSPLDGKFGDFCQPLVNNKGTIVFKANGKREDEGMMRAISPAEEAEKNEGVFIADSTGIKKVITGGDPFPGGGEFEIVKQRGFDDTGRVFFDNAILEGRAATGIYSILNGNVSTIASLGGIAADDIKFTLVYGSTLSVNKAGVVAFMGLLDNGRTTLFTAIPNNLLPQIKSIKYQSKKLTISGLQLTPTPTISINGVAISATSIVSQSDGLLVLSGSKKDLHLTKKSSNIVVVTVNNVASDSFSFNLGLK